MRKRMMEKLRKISTMYHLRQILAFLLVYCMIFVIPAQVAKANPAPDPSAYPSTGAGGYTATLGGTAGTVGNTTTITAPNGSVFDWQNFDIGSLHTVNITQLATDAVLNRVNVTPEWGDGAATGIFGNLNAPGNVFVVNPMGIVIGADAMIAAYRFVASGLNISNFDDFIAGNTNELQFEGYAPGTLGVELMAGGQITAETVGLIGKTVVNAGIITSDTVVLAAGEKVYLTTTEGIGGKIFVEVADLVTPDPAENTVSNTGTIDAPGGDVLLAAGDIYSAAITGVGKLAAVANRDIELDGNIQAGEMMLEADYDSDGSGDVTTTGTLTSTTGDIEISASNDTIYLGDDVDAAEDLILNDKTEAASDITLRAGSDVYILELLTSLGDLTIEATGGAIEAEAIRMQADGSLLSLTQYDSLNMEQALDDVYNSGDTDLSATSTAGSVSSSKADTWNSIAAHANTFISLNDSDTGGNITTEALTATNGDVIVTSNLGKVYAQGPISAGRDVKITATDESYDPILDSYPAIFLYEDIVAGRDIWLNNNTYAYGPISLTAGQDMRLGYNENLDKYDAKTLTAEESLTIEADRHVTLGGDVTVKGGMPKTLIIKADADTVDDEEEAVLGGDVWAMGALTTDGGFENDILVSGDNVQIDGLVTSAADIDIEAIAGNVSLGAAVAADGSIELTATDDVIVQDNLDAGGNIDIYSSDDTTYLSGDHVQATGNITLHNNTELNGTDTHANQRIDALTGMLTAMKDVDKSTPGSMTLAGDDGITLSGNVTGTGMTDADTLTFEDDVTANGTGDQRFDAGFGTLDADGSIAKTTDGKLNLGGDEGIELGGNVETHDGDLTFEDAVTANGTGEQRFDAGTAWHSWGNALIAEEDIDKVTDGKLTLDAGRDDSEIRLAGDVTTHDGDLVFEDRVVANGSGDQRLDAGTAWHSWGNALIAEEDIDKVTDGKLTLDAGRDDSEIRLAGDVTTHDGDLVFEDRVVANGSGDQRFDAGTSWHGWGNALIAEEDIDKTTDGKLTLDAGRGDSEIRLAGDVTTHDGDLVFEDKVVANGTGDQRFDAGTAWHSWGNDLVAEEDIIKTTDGSLTLDGGRDDVDSEIYLAGNVETHDGDLTFEDKVIANGSGNQRFDALGGELWAQETITKTTTGDLNLGGDDDIDLDGTVEVQDGSLTIEDHFSAEGDLLASENVTFEGSIVNGTLDGTGLQNITATNGQLKATGWIHKTEPGNLVMFGGSNDPRGSTPPYAYSVWTQDVTVDDGELTIQGNAWVQLDGSIYSSGNMWLTANNDGIDSGDLEYLMHTAGTIESEFGDVVLSAQQGNVITLNSSDATLTEYVTAGDDIKLNDYVWVQYDGKLDAGGDVILASGMRLQGNQYLTVEAGDDIILGADDPANPSAGGFPGNVVVKNDLILRADDDIYAYGDITSNEGSIELYSSNYTTKLYANVTAYDSVLLNNKTELRGSGDQRVEATNGTLTANRDVDKTTDGDLTLAAPGSVDTIYLGGDVTTHDGDLIFEDAVIANGTGSRRNQTFDADGDDKKLHAWDTITKTTSGNLTLSGGQGDGYEIDLDGDVTVNDGNLELGSLLSLLFGDEDTTVYAGGKLEASDDVKAYDDLNGEGNLTIEAGNDIKLHGDVTADGNLELYASDSTIYLYGDAYATGNILLNANTEFEGWDDQYVDADGTLTANGYLRKLNTKLFGLFKSDGSLYLHADGDISLADYVQAADKLSCYCGCGYDECGISSYGGGVSIISENGKIFTPAGEVGSNDTLNVPVIGRSVDIGGEEGEGIGVELPYGPGKAAIVIMSKEDLKLGTEAELTAYGLYKAYDLEGYFAAIEALGGVGDFFDGVAGADFGAFFDGIEGFGDFFDAFEDYDALMDALDTYCEGDIRGVIFGGDWSDYLAFKYYTAPDIFDSKPILGVDDRAGVGFLDDGDPATATIGGVLRNEGDPFDAAIYVASTEGDVDVSGPVTIMPLMQEVENEEPDGDLDGELRGKSEVECVSVPQGTMVIDAFDSVTFGELFEESLAGEDGISCVGERLEVVSRITEWLFQAIGRLPYPYVGGPFPLDYTYVLRGAGLDNLAITDGRAWVLEDPTPAPPLYEEAGQAIEPLMLGVEGCPVLVAAVSAELGIPGDTIQVSLANSFALNTNIQPCESCARLLNAAAILSDEGGSRMAAMNQVFNELAPAGAPFTPEVAASIVTAFAGHINDGTQYATAIEYIDAFVRYIAVLDTEMGSPVAGGDSIAFVMGKYGTGITASENSNIAAFVATRLESSETFGD